MKYLTPKKGLFHYIRCEGEYFPPFYYGYGYYDMWNNAWHFYVWPLHLFVRLWRALRQVQIEGWTFASFKEVETKRLKEEQ